MNKSAFITALAGATGLTKTDATKFYDAQIVVITDAIKNGEEVVLQDLCTFKPSRRSARIGRNPATGAKINIPSSLSVKVSVSAKIKKALN